MHLCYLLRRVSFQFKQFAFALSVNELVNAHVATANSHHQFVVHHFGVDLFGSEHVESPSNPSNWQLNSCLVYVASEHFIYYVPLDGLVNLSGSVLLFDILYRSAKFLDSLVFLLQPDCKLFHDLLSLSHGFSLILATELKFVDRRELLFVDVRLFV